MEPIKYIKRTKTVDVPEDLFKYLSIKAATRGGLKKYIEDLW